MLSHTASTHDDWDAHWEDYADAASQNPAQRMRHEFIAGLLAKQVSGPPARIFDIGSGQGDLVVLLAPLLPATTQYLGAELSDRGVRISQRKVRGATFVLADLFDPPRALEVFAGWATHAVCSEVLEHVDDPAEFLRRSRPYLADGAQLVVTVPGGPMSEFDRHIGHRQHFTRASIAQTLMESGFAVDRVFLVGFPFFNLYRLTVIARGERLAQDVRSGRRSGTSGLAGAVMNVFRILFRWNLSDSAFGWQVVAVARKLPA